MAKAYSNVSVLVQGVVNSKQWSSWLICALLSTSIDAQGQITTNIVETTGTGDLGTSVNQTGTTYDIIGGTRRGTNLFHSLAEFSVGVGDTAQFSKDPSITPPTITIQNILSRVTGNNPSNIYGAIKTAGFSVANLYLLNPAGVVFGPNASIDVSGSFHVSTADHLKFSDGNFDMSSTPPALKMTADPLAFGFMGVGEDIRIEGSRLTVKSGQTISMVSNEISISDGAVLTAPSGQISIAGIGPGDETLFNPALRSTTGPFDYKGTVSISGVGTTPSNLTAENGSVFIHSGQISIDKSDVSTFSSGDDKAGIIQIAGKSLELENGARLQSTSSGSGDGGNITITTLESVNVYGTRSRSRGRGSPIASTISSATSGSGGGNAGNIKIQTSSLNIFDDGIIQSTSSVNQEQDSAANEGLAGNIKLHTNQINVSDGGNITNSTSGSGRGGEIQIRSFDGSGSAELVRVDGNSSEITSETTGTGNGGSIDLQTNTLQVSNGGKITTETSGDFTNAGDGGSIVVNSNLTQIQNQGSISSSTLGQGDAGSIVINSNSGQLNILSGGKLSADTRNARGNGGNIAVNVAGLSIDGLGSGIFAQSLDNPKIASAKHGNAGLVDVTAQSLQITNAGQISTSTNTEGNAGNVAITTTNMNLAGGSEISAKTFQEGFGGNVTVNTSNLGLSGNSKITTQSLSAHTRSGAAGNIGVSANDIVMGSASQIAAETSGGGNAGDVNVATTTLSMADQSLITTRSLSQEVSAGRAGNINVNAARSVTLDNSSAITAETAGGSVSDPNPHSGNVNIAALELLRLNGNSRISVETQRANAGSIDIQVRDLLHLISSEISTSVAGGSGSGGNIVIDPKFVILEEGSSIRATAKQGSGGNIAITAGFFFRSFSPLSVIDASSEQGVDGNVVIRSPATDLTGGTLLLPGTFLDASAVMPERCAARTAADVSSFVVRDRSGIPPQPDSVLPSRYSDIDTTIDAGRHVLDTNRDSKQILLNSIDLNSIQRDGIPCGPPMI